MPRFGLVVGRVPPEDTQRVVLDALELGYRLIDTAQVYGNEFAVGTALAATDLDRSEIFVTTKLSKSDLGYGSALRAFDASVERLGLDDIDLYILHGRSRAANFTLTLGGPLSACERKVGSSRSVCRISCRHISNGWLLKPV
jgi:diketogulonate reductase-like aldo/keto reductase